MERVFFIALDETDSNLLLERVLSYVFEYDQAHPLIAVLVSRAIFEVFYLKAAQRLASHV